MKKDAGNVDAAKVSAARAEKLKIRYAAERSKTRFLGGVFGVIVVFLIAAFFGLGILFPTASNGISDAAKEQSKYKVPCLGENVAPIQPSNISVRVLNGSGKTGIAAAVASSFKNRGFSIAGIDALDFRSGVTEVRYGANAALAARVVSENLIDSVMILDDRTDGMVDVVVGGDFTNLVEEDMVITNSRTAKLVDDPTCVYVDDIVPIAALPHDEELVPAYKSDGSVKTDNDTPAGDNSGDGANG